VLFDSGLAAELREPRTLDELAAKAPGLPPARIGTILGVATSLGVVAADGDRYRLAEGPACMPPPVHVAVSGDIRSHVVQPALFLDTARAPTPTTGWRHTDPKILQAQGDASAQLAGAIRMFIGPQLGDLVARLDRPGARILDVGTGVAALAIALCRAFPQVAVTGLDVAEAPLAIARSNVARAQLGERIEIRELAVEALADTAAFDLAWLPQFFLSDRLPAALSRVRAALRPGGWILVPAFGTSPDPKARAVGTLICELWGGTTATPAELEDMVKAAGFANVRTLPGPPNLGMIVGQP
jgi:predicted O-methyltransferase YrrM